MSNQKDRYQVLVRNWTPHSLLLGMQDGAATVENGPAASQMVQRRVTMSPSNLDAT